MNLKSIRPDLVPAATLFAQAAAASRAWDAAAAEACREFGTQGPHVSGCHQEHFPEDVKNRLRTMAREVSRLSSEAWQARPARVRLTTIRRLRDAIYARDGRGFYG